MAGVTRKSCLDCRRPLRSSRALRCGRCRTRHERESAARRMREMRSRSSFVTAAPPSVAESPWRDLEDRPISPVRVLELLRDPANWPTVGSPEWRELKSNVETYTEQLAERDDPLASAFLDLCDELFPNETEEIDSIQPSLPATLSAGGRRVEVPISTLNVNDLLAWIQDPTWELEGRRRMAAELERQREKWPSLRDAIDRVLSSFRAGWG